MAGSGGWSVGFRAMHARRVRGRDHTCRRLHVVGRAETGQDGRKSCGSSGLDRIRLAFDGRGWTRAERARRRAVVAPRSPAVLDHFHFQAERYRHFFLHRFSSAAPGPAASTVRRPRNGNRGAGRSTNTPVVGWRLAPTRARRQGFESGRSAVQPPRSPSTAWSEGCAHSVDSGLSWRVTRCARNRSYEARYPATSARTKIAPHSRRLSCV